MGIDTFLSDDDPGAIAVSANKRTFYIPGDLGAKERVAEIRVHPNGRLSLIGHADIKADFSVDAMQMDYHERIVRVQISATPGNSGYRPYSIWYNIRGSGKLDLRKRQHRPHGFSVHPPASPVFSRGRPGELTLSRILSNGVAKPLSTQTLAPMRVAGLPVYTTTPDGQYLFVGFSDPSAGPIVGAGAWPISVYRVGKNGSLVLITQNATVPIASPVLKVDTMGRFLYILSANYIAGANNGKIYSYRIKQGGYLKEIAEYGAPTEAECLGIMRLP